jgi:GH25 family lysozyme M1 (1,4-beta-N-acetylmuramidase)
MRFDLRARRPALLGPALFAALMAISPLGAAAVAAASTNYVANCSINLRSSASTSATVVDTIGSGSLVTATGTVSGSSWSVTACPGSVSGNTWYVITAVNGTSTQSRYGTAAVYAATGLFKLAPPPPPPGTWLEGIDVSHWQGTINWASVAPYKQFAIMKATESTIYVDSQYATNHASARANGIRTGAYHFAQPSTTAGEAVAEADWFTSHANLQAGDLNPALDLEVANGLSTTALQTWVKTWLDRVYATTGMRPMVYTSPSFWRNAMGDTSAIADAGYSILWVAHWFVTSPSVPANNWGGKGWTFWQYDDCGSVPGVPGCVDLDRFNGTDLTKVTYGANFTVAAAPASQSVRQGGAASIAIAINRTWFTLPINLSVSGAPAGTAVSLAATTTASAATLTVYTSRTGTVTPVGSYPLTITANANGVTRTTTATMTVFDGVAPTVTAPTSQFFAGWHIGGNSVPGRTTWTGSDTGGISSFTLQSQVNGGTWTTVSTSPPTATSNAQQWTFNTTYRFRVQATDRAGNVSSFAYGPAFKSGFAQDNDPSVHYGPTAWAVTNSVYASGGTIHYTTKAGAYATWTFFGAGVAWVSYLGPTRGQAKVYIDGTYVQTVNLYSSTYTTKVVVFTRMWSANHTHTITLVNLATAGHPRIDLEGFAREVLS